MKRLTFKIGGIHPKENKLSAGGAIVDLERPAEVAVMVAQHIGAPAMAKVKKGDLVAEGQCLAEAAGFVSAPVHAPIAGRVVKVDTAKTPQGLPATAIYLKADPEAPSETVTLGEPIAIDEATPEQIVERIKAAGIVGMGGATFPTAVKLTPPPGKKADTLIINGAECEPYLTCDHALMLESPQDILDGTRLLRRAVGADRAVIAIETNKRDAIERLRSLNSDPHIEIAALKPKYPQGGEKQLIAAVTGREVPSGKLPIDVGVVVQNVATAQAVADAVGKGRSLTSRVLTVTGPEVAHSGNYRVAVGTPLSAVIEAAGGVPDDTAKVVIGGPMMGRAAQTLDSFTTKGLSGILLLPGEQASRGPVENCIRCARCVDACPMGLEPFLISTLSRRGDFGDAEKEKVMNCIECGSCSYVCPSNRPLLDYIRVGKQRVGALLRARTAKSN